MSDTARNAVATSRRRTHQSAAPMGIVRMAMLLAAMVLLLLALPPFFSFPWLVFWLLPLAAIYLFMLYVIPRLWLIVLPVATVGLTSPGVLLTGPGFILPGDRDILRYAHRW